VRHRVLDSRFEEPARDPLRARDVALDVLVLLADVDDRGAVPLVDDVLQLQHVGLANLPFDFLEISLKVGHDSAPWSLGCSTITTGAELGTGVIAWKEL